MQTDSKDNSKTLPPADLALVDVAPETALHDLKHHLDHGYVYSSPTAFGMAMVKNSAWPDDELVDPDFYCLPEEGDLWYFTRTAGNVAEVLSRLPFPLERCAWHRHRGESIRVIHYDFHKLCDRFRSHPHPVDEPHRPLGFHAI